MAQVYVIYLRSNLMVHDVISTRRTAAEDFQQFVNPVPGSYVDSRKRANPVLYANMSDVDFLVLKPPSSWLIGERADPLASWRSRPADVADRIRAALVLHLRPEELAQRAREYANRYRELMRTEGRELQADYPPEVLKEFPGWVGYSAFELYLTIDELLELREILRFEEIRKGEEPEGHWVQRVNRVLAIHEQLRLQEGKS